MIDINELRKYAKPENLLITEHARQRLIERNIKVKNIIDCINSGEIIKQYEDDKPFPSCLISGKTDGFYIHVVVSNTDGMIFLITAYRPDPEIWDNDFKTRRKK